MGLQESMRVTATLAVVATGALATRVAAEPTFLILPNMKSGHRRATRLS